MSEVSTETRDKQGYRDRDKYQQLKEFLNQEDLSKALAIAARAWRLSAAAARTKVFAVLLIPVVAVFLALGATHDRSPNFTRIATCFL
jgi:hypothetical protein